MKPNEYQKAAERTAHTPLYFNDQNGRPSQLLSHLDHAAKGMNTEQGELDDMLKKHLIYGKPFDDVNVLEECGDVLWYVALALRAIDVEMGMLWPPRVPTFPPSLITKLMRIDSAVKDMNRAQAMLNFDLELYRAGVIGEGGIGVLATSSKMLDAVNAALVACGYTMEQAMDRNIAKLMKRYPDKFTSEAALNRDLDGERATLEQVSE